MKANVCSTSEPLTAMKQPYRNSDLHLAIAEAKTKTEALQAMFDFISRNGGNAGATPEYWEKLRKMGVVGSDNIHINSSK